MGSKSVDNLGGSDEFSNRDDAEKPSKMTGNISGLKFFLKCLEYGTVLVSIATLYYQVHRDDMLDVQKIEESKRLAVQQAEARLNDQKEALANFQKYVREQSRQDSSLSIERQKFELQKLEFENLKNRGEQELRERALYFQKQLASNMEIASKQMSTSLEIANSRTQAQMAQDARADRIRAFGPASAEIEILVSGGLTEGEFTKRKNEFITKTLPVIRQLADSSVNSSLDVFVLELVTASHLLAKQNELGKFRSSTEWLLRRVRKFGTSMVFEMDLLKLINEDERRAKAQNGYLNSRGTSAGSGTFARHRLLVSPDGNFGNLPDSRIEDKSTQENIVLVYSADDLIKLRAEDSIKKAELYMVSFYELNALNFADRVQSFQLNPHIDYPIMLKHPDYFQISVGRIDSMFSGARMMFRSFSADMPNRHKKYGKRAERIFFKFPVIEFYVLEGLYREVYDNVASQIRNSRNELRKTKSQLQSAMARALSYDRNVRNTTL